MANHSKRPTPTPHDSTQTNHLRRAGKQIANLPAWLASEKFDLDCIANTPGSPNLDKLKTTAFRVLSYNPAFPGSRDVLVIEHMERPSAN